MDTEASNILFRYKRRKMLAETEIYNPLVPYNYMLARERLQSLIRLINKVGLRPVEEKTVLEIGCGSGTNLLQLILLGFRPENLIGNELSEERFLEARRMVSPEVRVILGDASELAFPDDSFDIILQSTVFTSILDNSFQEKLAQRMWMMLKPMGGIIWYDYVYNNPFNPDVRGVSIKRIRVLFPEARIMYWRVTLAPPIGRLVTKISSAAYTFLNALYVLRTHVICWIGK